MSKGIYPIDSRELVLDCTANKTDIRKINLADLLTEFKNQKQER